MQAAVTRLDRATDVRAMTVMTWPSIGDYSTAVQLPDRVFSVADIAAATFATRPPLHLPVAASGANAVVFRAEVAGKTTAVRCFTREPGEERTRYVAFAEHVAQAGLKALTPPQWHDNAMFVSEAWRPVVTMPWIGGQPLHRYVEDHLQDPPALTSLAERWERLLADLSAAEVAHGDLQHGNVLVTPDGSLHLIDFDGVWIPSIAHVTPTEWGHPNYQHPERGELGTWGPHIDWFAGLVIDVSLRALAADPALWERHNEENLIFVEDDFRGSTDIWDRLAQSRDDVVRERSRLLADGCAESAALAVDLPTLLVHGLSNSSGASAETTAGPGVAGAGASTAGQWWVGSDGETEAGSATTEFAAEAVGSEVRADAETNRTTFDWSTDTTGQVVTPWSSVSSPSSTTSSAAPAADGRRAANAPPERSRATRQAVNSAWSDDANTPPPAARPAGKRAAASANQPPPPTMPTSVPRQPQKAGGSWNFAATIAVAAVIIAVASAAIEESQVRDVVLAVVVLMVLVELVRVTRK